jgi:hypothetical protein
MTWLEKFQELCQKAPDNYTPSAGAALPKPGKGDVILGTLPPHLIKMSWVLDQLIDRIETTLEEHGAVCKKDDGEDCQRFWKEIISLKRQLETVKEIFFTSIREDMEIDSCKNPNLVIVEGWRVASISQSEDDSFEKLMRILEEDPIISDREFHG